MELTIPTDRPLSRYRIQANTTTLLETQPATQPDLVAQELETLTDTDDPGFIRMNPKTQFSFQHRTGTRQRPLRFLPSPAHSRHTGNLDVKQGRRTAPARNGVAANGDGNGG